MAAINSRKTLKDAQNVATRLARDVAELAQVARNPSDLVRYVVRTVRHRPLMSVAAVMVTAGVIVAREYLKDRPDPAPVTN